MRSGKHSISGDVPKGLQNCFISGLRSSLDEGPLPRDLIPRAHRGGLDSRARMAQKGLFQHLCGWNNENKSQIVCKAEKNVSGNHVRLAVAAARGVG